MVILLFAAGGIWLALNSPDNALPTPVPSLQPAPSTFISATPTPLRIGGFIGPSGLTAPGNCALSGSIEFTAQDTFASYDAQIIYRNIDSDGRLIAWRISPSDALAVGPNIMGALPLPDGSSSITIKLPDKPQARFYTLTATVGYGEFINNNVVVKQARCTGSIPVRLRY